MHSVESDQDAERAENPVHDDRVASAVDVWLFAGLPAILILLSLNRQPED